MITYHSCFDFYNIASLSLLLSLSACLSLARARAVGGAKERTRGHRRARGHSAAPLLTRRSVESDEKDPPLNGARANRRAGEAAFMQMCWQGRRSGSFIFFQRERWVNAKVILYEGGTVLDQNTAVGIAEKQRGGLCFIAARSLFFFQTLQGKWRISFICIGLFVPSC